MTFQECLSLSPFEILWQRMCVIYPEDKGHKESYEKVYQDILNITPVESEYRISIEFVNEEQSLGGNEYWAVSGVNDTCFKDIPESEGGVPEDHEAANKQVRYAIEFEPRAKWAGMVIDAVTVCEMPTIDIAVHCLWEMTFMGFEEGKVTEQAEIIKKRADDAKDMNSEDYVEVFDGVFCHKDAVDNFKKMFEEMDDINKNNESSKE